MKKYYILAFLFAGMLLNFIACDSQPKQPETEATSQIETEKYLAKGQQIAGATFTALSGKLQAAMKEGGVPNAVEYCSLAAYPMVDSLSKVHGATIRRTSLEVRNPKDAPAPAERQVLDQYEKADAAGEELKPIAQQLEGGGVAFYAPIRVNELCLQCHGVLGETMTEENYAVIKETYPEDQAIGYADGDLRGMWSIEFRGED